MSLDHDYTYTFSTKNEDGQVATGSQLMNNTEPRGIYVVQKTANGQPIMLQQQGQNRPEGYRVVSRDSQQRVVLQQGSIVRAQPGSIQNQRVNNQFNGQANLNYGMGGTIAGRAVTGHPQATNGSPIYSANTVYRRQVVSNGQQPQTVYVNSNGEHVRPHNQMQHHPQHQQQQQHHLMQQQQQQQHIQHQQRAPQQIHQQMQYQRQDVTHRQVQQQQHQQQMNHQMRNQAPQHHMSQQQQQQFTPGGMNLTIPLREPSPEPVAVVVEPVQQPPVQQESTSNEEPIPEDMDIDIQIRNVVCNYTLPLHIDLRKLAMNTNNVTYERDKGVMMKQKRNPNCYIKVYSSGKVYIVGCRSELDCKKAARSIARHVQKVMGKTSERVAMRNYRVNNVLATCRLPFGIKIEDVAAKYPAESTYEPELSVGLVWRSTTPKATLRVHTTGSITVTGASSEQDVLIAISNIYPIVLEFKCLERAKGRGGAVPSKRKRKPKVATRGPVAKRERLDDSAYGSSGVINNQVYFSDEDDVYDDVDFDDE